MQNEVAKIMPKIKFVIISKIKYFQNDIQIWKLILKTVEIPQLFFPLAAIYTWVLTFKLQLLTSIPLWLWLLNISPLTKFHKLRNKSIPRLTASKLALGSNMDVTGDHWWRDTSHRMTSLTWFTSLTDNLSSPPMTYKSLSKVTVANEANEELMGYFQLCVALTVKSPLSNFILYALVLLLHNTNKVLDSSQ